MPSRSSGAAEEPSKPPGDEFIVECSDNGTTQQIKVTVPAGSGVARRFVHLKVTRS